MSQSPTIRSKDAKDGGGNPRSTKQLLDELDDLMNQMLSLPVEDEKPAATKNGPALSATLTMIEPEQPAVKKTKTPRRSEAPSKNPSPPATPPERDESDIPIYRTEPAVNGDKPTDISDEMIVEEPAFTPFRRESRPMPRSNASWVVRTLVVWDRGFRRFTRRLGPIGWLLRTSFGRMLLGLCGLACWIFALAWLIRDWMQWTH